MSGESCYVRREILGYCQDFYLLSVLRRGRTRIYAGKPRHFLLTSIESRYVVVYHKHGLGKMIPKLCLAMKIPLTLLPSIIYPAEAMTPKRVSK